jgi:hypothetical protein
MIDHRNPNHRFPLCRVATTTLALLRVKGTTFPLEAVGGRGGTPDELGVEAPAAPDAPSEVESDGDEVEEKVCFLLPVPTDPSPTPSMALRGGGGGIRSTESPISSSASVCTGSGTSSSSSSSSVVHVAALYTPGETWKKSSIHLVCPWGQVSSQGVIT